MKISKFGTAATALAAFGLVVSSPVFASAPMRSSEALPSSTAGLRTAALGTVPYTPDVENVWHCAQAGSAVRTLKGKSVRVDEAGRVVVNSQGSPFGCRSAAAGSYQADPLSLTTLLLIIGGGAAATFAAVEIIKNDSPG